MDLPNKARRSLPIILIFSVVQGWALYGLHLSIKHHHWPATHPAWLLALYAVSVFIPVMIQLLAARADNPEIWAMATAVAAAMFYFGWFLGTNITPPDVVAFNRYEILYPASFELLLWWLVLLPFLQSRLATGSWIPRYQQLFCDAWHNKLTLAEAALFTGLFWALLGLWQQLFHMLRIDYFRELFQEPIFIYPVTALIFGLALHLIGSSGKWTQVVLEQLLSVLKWLAPVAGVILALFSVALIPKLSTMLFFGNRAISAGWLLWLVAVVVLLANAAYRDGSMSQPYPMAIGKCLRIVMPLLNLVAATGAYAVMMRTREYGVTVERYWALVVAGFALVYSVGYSWAAVDGRTWMQRIAPVNICAALLMLAVLSAALSAIATPYRLAADSQYRKALHLRTNATVLPAFNSQGPLEYLRFSTGTYGIARLREIANDPLVPADLQSLAARTLASNSPWAPVARVDPGRAISGLNVYPSGAAITADLQQTLQKDLQEMSNNAAGSFRSEPLAGLFVDLDADGIDEFVLLWTSGARVYHQDGEHWRIVGDMQGGGDPPTTIVNRLSENDVHVHQRRWNDLQVGRRWYRFAEDPK